MQLEGTWMPYRFGVPATATIMSIVYLALEILVSFFFVLKDLSCIRGFEPSHHNLDYFELTKSHGQCHITEPNVVVIFGYIK